MKGSTGNIPAGLLAHRRARIRFQCCQQGELGAGIRVNPAPHQSDSVGSDMGIGIAGQKGERAGQHVRLVRTAGSLLAPVAIQHVQSHAAHPLVPIIQHIRQVVHHLRHQVLIEELAAAQAYVAVRVAKPLANGRQRRKASALQRAKSRPGVMRERQLAQKRVILPFHTSLRSLRAMSRSACGRS